MKPIHSSRNGRCSLLALCLFLALPAWAERADRDKPMNIESDALRHEDQTVVHLHRSRGVTKGSIVMRGARLTCGRRAGKRRPMVAR